MGEQNNQSRQYLDALSKAATTLLIVVSGSGILVTLLHDASFGFTLANPLRAKVGCAGAWFLLFSSFPAYIAVTYLTFIKRKYNLKVPIWRALRSIVWYSLACQTTAGGTLALFSIQTPGLERHKTLFIVLSTLLLLCGGLAVSVRANFPRVIEFNAVIAILSFLGLNLFALHDRSFSFEPYTVITLWLFALGLLSLLPAWHIVREADVPRQWLPAVFLFLGAAFTFASLIYPNIKASWGGGQSVPVVLYVKDVPFKENVIQAQLIDESEGGIYVVPDGEQHAMFIPKESVRLIHYSDKLGNSKFLADE